MEMNLLSEVKKFPVNVCNLESNQIDTPTCLLIEIYLPWTRKCHESHQVFKF